MKNPLVWILLAVGGFFVWRYFKNRPEIISTKDEATNNSTSSVNIGQIGATISGFPIGPVSPGNAFGA